MMCLDTELRRRNGDTYGACNLMADVVAAHAMDTDAPRGLGVDYADLRSALQRAPGGASMGPFLDRLVTHRQPPPVEKAMRFFRLKLTPEHEPKPEAAWLGVGLNDNGNRTRITTFHAGSPMRLLAQVGDEIVAVEGLRVASAAHLSKLLQGRADQPTSLSIVHEGVLSVITVTPSAPPQHGTELTGKGNDRWRAWIASRQSS